MKNQLSKPVRTYKFLDTSSRRRDITVDLDFIAAISYYATLEPWIDIRLKDSSTFAADDLSPAGVKTAKRLVSEWKAYREAKAVAAAGLSPWVYSHMIPRQHPDPNPIHPPFDHLVHDYTYCSSQVKEKK